MANALGLTIDELLTRYDSAQLAEQAALHDLEPWTDHVLVKSLAQIESWIANYLRGGRGEPIRPSQLIPERHPHNPGGPTDELPPQQSPAEQKALIATFVAMAGAGVRSEA